MKIYYFDEFSRTTKLKPQVQLALWVTCAGAVVAWIAGIL